MLTWRFAVQLNRSLVELVGLVIEKTEVVYLQSFSCVVFKKTFQVTCRVASFPDTENEVDLILLLAGIFESLKGIDDFTNFFSVLGGVVIPIVDVGCQTKCPAMVKVGRFRNPIGELVSVYH